MPKHKYPLRKSKYSKEILESIVKESHSIREVLRKLGLSSDGGHKRLRKNIRDCDISHFTGQGWLKGKTYKRKSDKEFFIKNGTHSSCLIRDALFKRNIKKRICERCGLTNWLENDIPLEVHHKNGIGNDNRIENLEILCPNCHYFTPNYRVKNAKKGKFEIKPS